MPKSIMKDVKSIPEIISNETTSEETQVQRDFLPVWVEIVFSVHPWGLTLASSRSALGSISESPHRAYLLQ